MGYDTNLQSDSNCDRCQEVKSLEREIVSLRAELTSAKSSRDNYKAQLEEAQVKITAAQTLAARRGKHMARQSQHLYDTREKLRKVEKERDGHRERYEALLKTLNDSSTTKV